jgi:predicted  nucleic acid-binding Zn-ribbon protein
MTYQQIDRMTKQIRQLKSERDTARGHAVNLQDQLESLKARLSSQARKITSKRNGLKGGRPKKNKIQ